ncbi:hypothetical protein HK104_011374 [Borealophlyctis nickersoniae]|nr:hypothetical protein HK104_011374 [Borealophlyctis nickersoniae]
MHIPTRSLLSAGLLLLASSPALVNAAECFQNFPKSDFPNCQLLDKRYALHWAIKDGEITFAASVDVDNAWFALGLSDNGGMRGADITVISDNNGKLIARDYWAEVAGAPSPKKEQSSQIKSDKSSRKNGVTNAVWTRPLITCSEQTQSIANGTVQAVIWALGESDVFGKHANGNRGDTRINFMQQTAAEKPKDPSDLQVFEMFFDNYTVPADQETTYTCIHTSFQAPPPPAGGNGTNKYHVIRYEGVARNKEVHHMIIYGCNAPPTEFNKTYECTRMETSCSTFLFGWAPGIGVIDMPEEAGFAIGQAADAFQYFSLQIHYNNQDRKSIVDSSGFRLWYTSQLRKHDMGVIFTGVEDMTIPGSTPMTTLKGGECPSVCTKRFPGPITIQWNAFHMHTIGRNMTTKHIRDGRELTPLGVRNHYDFNYQSITSPINGPRTFLPGDSLITTCSYDSSSRPNSTHWGEGTSDEMCYNIVQYYPRFLDVDWCTGLGEGFSMCAPLANYTAFAREARQRNATMEEVSVGLMTKGLIVPSNVYYEPSNTTCTPSKLSSGTNGASSLSSSPAAAGILVAVSAVLALMA